MNDKIEKVPETRKSEKLDAPEGQALTNKGDQKTHFDLKAREADSVESPSETFERLTGKEAAPLKMIDSADSRSMQDMEYQLKHNPDEKASEELAMRRSIRENMEPGPERDHAEKIAKEVFRAKETIPPGEHLVTKGDNLWRIARIHLGKGASDRDVKEHVDQIVKINGIKNPDLIYPGERFKLPGYTINGDGDGALEARDGAPKARDRGPEARDRAPAPLPEGGDRLADYKPSDIEPLSKNTTLDEEKEKLWKAIGTDPDTKRWFKEHMDEFETRQRQNPDTLSKDEVKETYAQISRLLTDKTSKLITPAERESLSQQIMLQAAMPETISQGQHATCSVAAVEVRTYTRAPSQAARLVTDIALDGKYHATRGPEVHLDPKTVDPESINSADDAANRTHASEIFEKTAVNLMLADKNARYHTKLRYEQRDPAKSGDSGEAGDSRNSGEAIMDYSGDKPVKVSDFPSLNDDEVVDINSFITGKDESKCFIINEKMITGDRSKLTVYGSEQDFLSKLIQLRDQKQYPLIFKIFSGAEPFYSDSGYDKEGGIGGSHIVTINKLIEGPPPKVLLDNQWEENKDHLTEDRAIPVHDLFVASQFPEDSVKYIHQDLENKRESGTATSADELDFVRMKILATRATDTRPHEKELQDFIDSIDKTATSEEEKKLLTDRSYAAIFSLTEDGIMRMREFMHKRGNMTDEEYESSLIEYGVTANTRKSHLGIDHKCNFANLVNNLPEGKRLKVLQEVSKGIVKVH